MADLTVIGDQSGCTPSMNAASPAMCGLAIEVPEYRSKSRPLFDGGATAARTLTPGAEMSGLMTSESLATAGPREENPAICGSGVGEGHVVSPSWMAAVAPVVAAYAMILSPESLSTCTVGKEWKSGSSRVAGDGSAIPMATPRGCLTAALLATRSFTPRTQTTIFP